MMEEGYFYLRWGDGYCSSMEELTRPQENRFLQARFLDYIRDEAGTPIGVRLTYDAGHGYGFDYSDSRAKLYPHQRASLTYKYTDTSEGGSDWFNDYIENDVELIPIEELTDRK